MPGPELRRPVLRDERVANVLLHANDLSPVPLQGERIAFAAESLALL